MFAEEQKQTGLETVELNTLFFWSTMHGLASILQTSAISTLALPPTILEATAPHVLRQICAALEAEIAAAREI